MNNSVKAGINYGYRNPTAEVKNVEILVSYFAAVGSSVLSAILLRVWTNPLLATLTGGKYLLLNTLVAQVASLVGHFASTALMRRSEVTNGIKVYADKKLTRELGVCKSSGRRAVL
jgi:hypothetical protein